MIVPAIFAEEYQAAVQLLLGLILQSFPAPEAGGLDLRWNPFTFFPAYFVEFTSYFGV